MEKYQDSPLSNGLISKEARTLDVSRSLVAAGLNDKDLTYLDYLRDIGYVIERFPTTRGLKEHIIGQIPNVLLIDYDYLGDSAIEITHALKDNPLTYTMPIIIVLGHRNIEKEIAALEAGAEDFIVKPFVPQALAARIYTSIRRNIRLQISNPLTGLPGAIYIEEQTAKRLACNQPVSMCYVDLVDFKSYNDKYGYNRGDSVIKLLATILNEGVSMYCNPGDFVGHIGGDDFVMITHPSKVDEVCKYIITSFDTLIPFQYDEVDMENRCIVSVNRQGEQMVFPLMTCSIGIVSNINRKISSYLEMTELAAEMKNYAKILIKTGNHSGSLYRADQRTK